MKSTPVGVPMSLVGVPTNQPLTQNFTTEFSTLVTSTNHYAVLEIYPAGSTPRA